VRARTERELESYLHRIDSLREELRLDIVTAEDVDRKIRRLRFGSVTLGRAARSYVQRTDVAQNTRRRIESAIRSSLAELAAEELDALDGPRLSRHFDKLAGRMAQSSLGQIWRTLRAIVRHAAEKGWIARVPWGTWRPRARAGGEGRALRECCRTADELAQLLSAAGHLDVLEAPYRALEAKVACAALLGLRQGELAGLRWYDTYPDRGTVAIRRQWDDRPLKTWERAELAAPPALFLALERHRVRLGLPPRGRGYNADAVAFGKHAGDPLFPSPSGGHYPSGECLSTRDLRAIARGAALNTLSAWSPHSLRDTFVTLEAQRAGGDFAKLASRTRHRSIASLVRYLRRFDRAVLVAVAGAELPALPEASDPQKRNGPTLNRAVSETTTRDGRLSPHQS
jgi:integrase